MVVQSLKILVVMMSVMLVGSLSMAAPDAVDFNRDIRPILSNYCFKCHGFDETARVHDLRLDDAKAALVELSSGERAIVPGDPEMSGLIDRVTSADPELRMPPPETNQQLSQEQVKLLRDWIASGAKYEKHWSYVSPKRIDPPSVNQPAWPRNEIDQFVLARLEKAGLQPSREASRRKLIRRLYFDLIGLVPGIEEVNEFVSDNSPSAYQRLVDRLLESPHYGERMAQNWLDAARYADTTGYAADAPRTQWLYRDWVIRAFNENKPFDQFTIEQIAGDMLPNATVNDRIATGFYRQSTQALGNNPRKEEFRIKGVVDRLMTTGRVWMGLTLECAECHNHKYDPITQREYYQLFAIFNNVPHLGETFGVHGPRLKVLPTEHRQRRVVIRSTIDELEGKLEQGDTKLAERQLRWEQSANPQIVKPNRSPLGIWIAAGKIGTGQWEGSSRLVKQDETAAPDWLSDEPFKNAAALKLAHGNHVRVTGWKPDEKIRDLTVSAWIKTDDNVADIVSNYDWRPGKRSFVFGIGGEGEPNAPPGRLFAWSSAKTDQFSGVEIYGSQRVNDGRWHHVALTMHSGGAAQLFVDGLLDSDAKMIGSCPDAIAISPRDLAIGAGFKSSADSGAFPLEGQLSHVQIFDAVVDPYATMGGFLPSIKAALEQPKHQRTPQQVQAIADYYLRIDPERNQILKRIASLHEQDRQLDADAIEAQVMEEMATPRETYLLVRGDFFNQGERVHPDVPSIFPALGEGPKDRLAFAKWLVADDHPLTARVTVNRIWQQFFAHGLVRTDADFGYQGEWPTHPRLLDWLSTEFVENGWNGKELVRLIVMSSTYRQDSSISNLALERDPENRLLARAARFRLPAEQIRDAMLSAGNLLDRRVGGPSVFPVQPDGLYGERTTAAMGPFEINWETSVPEDRYRRGMYIFWKRTILYPSLKAFDAPARDVCRTRRSITNTPMQALVALNDPVFVEGARALAERVLKDSPQSDFGSQLAFAFRIVLGRNPDSQEKRRFQEFYQRRKEHFLENQAAAEGLLKIGVAAGGRLESNANLAAWTLVASTIQNLDEAITRE